MTAPRRRQAPPLPSEIERIFLIGVCGTGMGSLAGMLQLQGYEVLGSDKNAYPPMSDWLAERGIEIRPGWDADNIHALDPPPDLVVVGNVCRPDNPEALAAIEEGLVCLSFPEVLRELFLAEKAQRIVVTGTHGKTTTSAMIAWILESAGHAPSFMIGGITGNFGSNYKLDEGPFVIEGDEYDSAYFDKVPKFWHYEPTTLVINNIEFDHADIYPDLEEIVGVFEKLVREMPADGVIIAHVDEPNVSAVLEEAPCAVRSLRVDPDAADRGGSGLAARGVELVSDGGARFDVWRDGEMLGSLDSPLPGLHNVKNLLAATGVALELGLDLDEVQRAIAGFESVRKRQELVGTVDGVAVYDDFAHHPTAVRETVRAIRSRHPDARLWGVFEAKSNTSRRAVFQDDYVDALRGCDRVILSRPWRDDPNLGPEQLIDLDKVVSDLAAGGTPATLIGDVDAIVDHVSPRLRDGDVVLGMSGSSFGGLHHKLLERLQMRPS